MEGGTIVRDAETSEAMIAGTDVTVARVLRRLEAAGRAAVLEAHPELTEEAVFAAVSFALAATRREVRYDASAGAGPEVVREAAAVAYGRARTLTRGAGEIRAAFAGDGGCPRSPRRRAILAGRAG